MARTHRKTRKSGIEYLIDANIFLEFLLGQEREAECRKFLNAIEEGKYQAYVTSFTLHGIEVIMDHSGKRDELMDFLQRVEGAKGLTVYPTSPNEEREAVRCSKKFSLDFDDALQYYVTSILRLTLVSFDKDFDRADVARIEPRMIL